MIVIPDFREINRKVAVVTKSEQTEGRVRWQSLDLSIKDEDLYDLVAKPTPFAAIGAKKRPDRKGTTKQNYR